MKNRCESVNGPASSCGGPSTSTTKAEIQIANGEVKPSEVWILDTPNAHPRNAHTIRPIWVDGILRFSDRNIPVGVSRAMIYLGDDRIYLTYLGAC